jgi:hypothetical protein
MNKIPSDIENPIDVYIMRGTAHVLPFMRATHPRSARTPPPRPGKACRHHTPNIITTYSFLAGLAAVWLLRHGHPFWFAAALLLGYVFDCASVPHSARGRGAERPWTDSSHARTTW